MKYKHNPMNNAQLTQHTVRDNRSAKEKQTARQHMQMAEAVVLDAVTPKPAPAMPPELTPTGRIKEGTKR